MKIKNVIYTAILIIGILNSKFIFCPIFGPNGWREKITAFEFSSKKANELLAQNKFAEAKHSLNQAHQHLDFLKTAANEIKISQPVVNFFNSKFYLGLFAATLFEPKPEEALKFFELDNIERESNLKIIQNSIEIAEKPKKPIVEDIKYIGGGVLPYAKNPYNNKLYFLLSREAFGRAKGNWSDFGGVADLADKNIAHNIAAREFTEESIKLFGTLAETQKKLSSSNPDIYKINTPYVMYLMKVSYDPSINTKFIAKRTATTDFHEKEKDKLQWVSIDRLKKALIAKNPNIQLEDGTVITLRGVALKLFSEELLPILDKLN